jgi:hypothetical protein
MRAPATYPIAASNLARGRTACDQDDLTGQGDGAAGPPACLWAPAFDYGGIKPGEDRQRSEDEPAMHGGGHALADREQEREADESAEGGDSKGQDEAARRQRQPEREGQGRRRNTAKECPQHRYREGFDLLGGKLGQHWRRPPHHHDCQRKSEGQPVAQWSGRAATHPQLG